MYQPIQTLPEGALDIVGDVHGEWLALQNLLRHLGYDGEGNHPQGRKLVFVGDLCDRGPESPAVLAWFKRAYEAGNALAVLGNHELNAIIGDPKDGSGWFFPRTRRQRRSLLRALANTGRGRTRSADSLAVEAADYLATQRPAYRTRRLDKRFRAGSATRHTRRRGGKLPTLG